jgi:hypothetical protein
MIQEEGLWKSATRSFAFALQSCFASKILFAS